MKNVLTQTGYFVLGFGWLMQAAQASPYSYPAIRYISPYSESLGGVTEPLTEETGNALFNNPAALSHNTKFKAEFLNLDLDAGSNAITGTSAAGLAGLSGMSSTLNANQNKTYASGFGNLTALSWGGLGVGLLYQDRTRAYSDGTHIHYQTDDQLIPAVGYGLALARGVVRLGASLQYINEVSGTNQISSAATDGSFTRSIDEGHALSATVSGSVVFPYTYLPTFTLLARNVGGLRYTGGSIYPTGSLVSGQPANEPMSVDAAFNIMVRVTGTMKTYWYFEYDDAFSAVSMPFLQRLRAGLDFQVSPHVGIRGGITGDQFSAGIGYRSEDSEINLAMYSEQSPFSSVSYWDRRYALQYKIYFQETNKRDRNSEKGPTK